MLGQRRHLLLAMVDREALAGRAQVHIKPMLGDVDADERGSSLVHDPVSLDAGSLRGPGDRSGCAEDRAGGAPCFRPALADPWESGLPPAGLPDPGTRSGHANIRMGKLCGRKGDSGASSIKEDHSAGASARGIHGAWRGGTRPRWRRSPRPTGWPRSSGHHVSLRLFAAIFSGLGSFISYCALQHEDVALRCIAHGSTANSLLRPPTTNQARTGEP
jgi:hypothetical protein